MSTPSTHSPPRTRVYTAQYRERMVLGNGELVQLRLLRAADASRLQRSFLAMSQRSITARFLKPRSEITAEEIRPLVEDLGDSRFAIGVLARRWLLFDGPLLASAHYERNQNEPDNAEIVIHLIDRVQSLGLGRIVLTRLIAAARENNIERLSFTMLSSNAAARRLFASAGVSTSFERAGETTSGVISLVAAPEHAASDETPDAGAAGSARRRRPRWPRRRR